MQPGRARFVFRNARPSACASGPAARRPSRPSAASRRITTAWMARYPASGWPKCSPPSPPWKRNNGLRCANVFHAGDGNLHPLIMYDASQPGNWERAEAFGRKSSSCRSPWAARSPANMASVSKRSTRCARSTRRRNSKPSIGSRPLRRNRLAQPRQGRASLHRCAEYGRMHVHHGDVKFPELERF